MRENHGGYRQIASDLGAGALARAAAAIAEVAQAERASAPDLASRARLLAVACSELADELAGAPATPSRTRAAEQCAEIRAGLAELGWTTADAAKRWGLPARTVERLAVPRPDVPADMRTLALALVRAELAARSGK